MKYILLTLIVALFSLNGLANDSSSVKLHHGVSLEFGAYHRGMIGLGYHAFLDTKHSDSYYGITASFGTKYPWVNPEKDLFLTLAISRNTRYRKHNPTYGLECKYIMAPYWDDLSLVQSYKEFEDFTYGVFFGFEWFLLDYMSLQPRLSYARSFHPLTQPAPWYSFEENYYSALGLGASILFHIKS
jgi:hypothetical protein